MKRLKFILLSLICFLQVVCGQTTEGTEFWVTFMRNSGSSGQDNNKDISLYLYATARENATVTITNPNRYGATKTFTVRAGKQDSCLVDNSWAYIENDKEVSKFGIKVTSTKPISLYATNQHSSGKYDATNILPTTALSSEYVVQTYSIDQYSTEFAVVSTANQTITIHLKKTTIDIQEYDVNQKIVVTSRDEETFSIRMYAGQTYLYRSASNDGGANASRATSLSGTTINSDQPIALFVGGQSAKVPFDPENHIFAQAYPTDKWGQTFYVTPTYGMVYDFVQFTACKNNTQIRRDGTLIATINAKESYIDTIKSVLQYTDDDEEDLNYTPIIGVYRTSEPTECFLYGTGYAINHPLRYNGKESKSTTDFGAPVLTPIVPQELATKSTMFATFTKTKTNLHHYVNIVTPTTEVSGMRLDNTNISADFRPIAGTNYSYAIMEVSNTAHKIENVRSNENSTFTARVYGMGQHTASKESYAYAAGSITVLSDPNHDPLFLPYEAFSLTPEQQELSPERLAYPTEMKEIIKNEIKFQCDGQLEEPTTPFVFSVSPSTKVLFSPGNLQFNAAKGSHQCADGTTQQGTWRFAEHQWDYVGDAENGNVYENGVKCNNELISSTYNGWIDLFGWGTSGWNSGANSYKPYETSQSYEDYYPGGYDNTDLTGTYAKADWGVYNQIGDVSPGTWRTMSKDEWLYLFHERKDAEKLFALGTVNGVPGAIILPDDWITPSGITFTPSTDKGLVWKDSYYIESGGDHYSDNVYTAAQWDKMESGGAVFLPSAVYRSGIVMYNSTYGVYWSSSHSSLMYSVYNLYFNTEILVPQIEDINRSFGFAVRLVSDVK